MQAPACDEPGRNELEAGSGRLFTLLVAFTSLWAETIYAQQLRGVKIVKVVVSGIDEDARRCDVSSESIESEVLYVLQKSMIKATAGTSHDMLVEVSIVVLSNPTSKQCAANLMLMGGTTIMGQTSYGKGTYWSIVHQNFTTLMYGRDKFSQKVGEQVEALTKQFIVQWVKDNG